MSQSLLKYWRLSLADGQNSSPAISGEKVSSISIDEIKNGHIDLKLAEQFVKLYQQELNNDDIDFALIAIAPVVLRTKMLHAEVTKNTKEKKAVPIWLPAIVHANGRLSPNTNALPWMNRTCLTPSSTEDFIVGEIDDLDRFLEQQEDNENTSWDDVQGYAEKVWKAVTGTDLFNTSFDDYSIAEEGLITLHVGQIKSASRLIELCNDLDEIDEEAINMSALRSLIMQKGKKAEAIDKTSLVSAQTHLGYIGKDFDLSPSQREALANSTALEDEEILAINGPPGTGKTTLIQSVIATGVVKAALDKKRPFVALASSTNNQAITNLIDSLKEAAEPQDGDILSFRWVESANSLGLFFPSKSALEKLEEGKYLHCLRKDNFWNGFPEEAESKAFVEKAEANIQRQGKLFLEKGDIDLQALPNVLYELLSKAHASFKEYTEIPDKLARCISHYQSRGHSSIQAWEEAAKTAKGQAINQKKNAEEKYQAEKIEMDGKHEKCRQLRSQVFDVLDGPTSLSLASFFDMLFGFLPSVKRKKIRRVAAILEKQGYRKEADVLYSRNANSTDVETVVEQIVRDAEETIISKETEYAFNSAKQELEHAKMDYDLASETSNTWQELWVKAAYLLNRFTQLSRNPSAPKWEEQKLYKDYEKSVFGLHEIADRFMRRRMFFLALRYWECCWLLEAKKELEKTEKERKSQSKKAMEERYLRYAMLTPCFVSTFFTAPSIPLAKTMRKVNGKKTYPMVPMVAFFDLLIVDEAGQVSPEIGGPVFSLAKKAVVVGDTKQIEPVVTLSPDVDHGNIMRADLGEDYDFLHGKGFMATNGNVMEMAQHVSAYTRPNGQGMFLAEHRRCYDEIIGYCNNFYEGQLRPLRNKAPKDNLFPPMGYAHIRGIAKRVSGSWVNELEANALAEWLAKNRQIIEEKYAKELHEIVAIVTPFKGQAQSVRKALEAKGITANQGKQNSLTVGTVHSLQGAERSIVIFSTVYDKNSGVKHFFFDRGPSMLNVAVSRAKDSFIVFGDMEAFSVGNYTPSQKLMNILFASTDNEIKDVVSAQELAQFSEDINRIDTLEQHQAALNHALESSKDRVLIVSPFLSENAIKIDAIHSKINSAIERGVDVCIVTCKDNISNYPQSNAALNVLSQTKAKFLKLPKIHNKTLAIDDEIIVEGSFNWLSASRTNGNKEISLVYRGVKSQDFIERAWNEFVQD